ncbi:hypothetical protein HMPREF9630_00870 [Peptoanaerobacter stomatis]|uniref:Uncharacterized protein n=1 Tax=Peptoanaerobacter stomatis TaxID=796937 RepID=J4WBB9_9FIRM|nr:hypothetical protein [Peptoanaerobacter stomatis]EHL14827.1 hypothetical protein HMPREF9630_00870 [Peptoanaerobacter stomatis]EJU22881.1 hypothetical protein HMPREF1143_0965 [Peptoanaerobacter stomatis]NWO25518.1 hypothetical protein [Peptostreptococcaceae bacterium oral taxon 081]
MIFDYLLNNKGEIGAKIMITAILLAICSFINPTLFNVHVDGVDFYENYYYSLVRSLSWFVFVIMLFFFGFAIFLRGRKNEDDK